MSAENQAQAIQSLHDVSYVSTLMAEAIRDHPDEGTEPTPDEVLRPVLTSWGEGRSVNAGLAAYAVMDFILDTVGMMNDGDEQ